MTELVIAIVVSSLLLAVFLVRRTQTADRRLRSIND